MRPATSHGERERGSRLSPTSTKALPAAGSDGHRRQHPRVGRRRTGRPGQNQTENQNQEEPTRQTRQLWAHSEECATIHGDRSVLLRMEM